MDPTTLSTLPTILQGLTTVTPWAVVVLIAVALVFALTMVVFRLLDHQSRMLDSLLSHIPDLRAKDAEQEVKIDRLETAVTPPKEVCP